MQNEASWAVAFIIKNKRGKSEHRRAASRITSGRLNKIERRQVQQRTDQPLQFWILDFGFRNFRDLRFVVMGETVR